MVITHFARLTEYLDIDRIFVMQGRLVRIGGKSIIREIEKGIWSLHIIEQAIGHSGLTQNIRWWQKVSRQIQYVRFRCKERTVVDARSTITSSSNFYEKKYVGLGRRLIRNTF